MTYQDRIRRIGWIALLLVCGALYLALHLKVQSVKSDLVLSERQIVSLEEQNLLLETEFQTRSSQLQLAQWNRVDFGFSPPEASQFIKGERQLAMLGGTRDTPLPGPLGQPGQASDIQLASYSPGEDAVQANAAAPVFTKAVQTVAVTEPARPAATLTRATQPATAPSRKSVAAPSRQPVMAASTAPRVIAPKSGSPVTLAKAPEARPRRTGGKIDASFLADMRDAGSPAPLLAMVRKPAPARVEMSSLAEAAGR